MRKFLNKNRISAALMAFLLTVSSIGTVFAESNLTGMPESMKDLVKGNYWAELEYKSNNPIPKYLMTPEQSSLNGIESSTNDDKSLYRNTGIRTDRTGLMDVNGGDYLGDFLILSYKMMADNPELMETPEALQQFNMDLYKAFKLDINQNMPLDNDLYIYGDISVSGDTQDKKVADISKGESINLTFSLDTSRMKKAMNAILLWTHSANNGGTPQQSWDTPMNSAWKKDFADSDSELVFVLDLPSGVIVDSNTKYSISGVNGFNITPKVEGQRLVVSVRKDSSKSEKSLKKIYEIINNLDSISLNVSNLKMTDSVELEKELKIIGYSYGAYDLSYGTNEAVIKSRDMSKKVAGDYIYREYYMMAAKQSDSGRDSTADANKPNLISYTFKVNKPATSTVTFINGSDRYASVKVENGKSIDEDSLTDQSMPTNPTKSGYTFKGWATKKDAKTPDFTGKTVVNNDLTVYAIWEKNPTPVNPGGGSTTDPIVPNKPERIDGNDRIETAVKVSQKSYPNGTKAVILANKDKFSDVLTAVPFSVQIGAPILFTNTDSIPVETKNEIKRLGATQVYINGGTSSVTQSIEDTLKKEGKSVTRFNGVDRYDTAKLIGERVRTNGSKDVVEIASGETFPDALSISSLAVKENAPILLSKKNDLTPVTKKAISDWKIEKATIAGQTNTISAMVEKDVTNVIKKTSRLGGADRYETSAIIAKAAVPDSTLGVYTSGEVFADALVAGPYAGINKAPVLLVNKDRVPTSIAKYTKESKINRAVVIGGTSTVYDSTFNQIKDLIAKK
ncbi:MAG: cell wall-binding repeat-containing protein [Peptostreptococcus porci]|nr:cell wall-binding repeat-containing protein [Peptostreptococcus porci]